MNQTDNLTLIQNQRAQNSAHLNEFLAKDTDKVSGRIGFIKLNSGISLHFTDITELVTETSVRQSEPEFTISLLLEGQVKFYMNDKPYYLGRSRKGHGPQICGKMWSTTKPVKFTRNFKKGHKVKKIIIAINRDWLSEMGLTGVSKKFSSEHDRAISTFAASHLNNREWLPSKQAIRAAEEIINPPYEADCMRKMVRESRAIELVTQAFESFHPAQKIIDNDPATRDNCRLIKVHSFIEDNLDREFTLEEIAKNVGFSVSSLQRHFKATYGATVVDYIRRRKLERAKHALQYDGLSVSEACFLAGYSTPSSFATAFKRAFGCCPKTFSQR